MVFTTERLLEVAIQVRPSDGFELTTTEFCWGAQAMSPTGTQKQLCTTTLITFFLFILSILISFWPLPWSVATLISIKILHKQSRECSGPNSFTPCFTEKIGTVYLSDYYITTKRCQATSVYAFRVLFSVLVR